jgi:hypothetical protein
VQIQRAFFSIALSENVHILYLFPMKFDPRFSLWPRKEVMLPSPMLTIKLDRVSKWLAVLTQFEEWACMFKTRWFILGWIVDTVTRKSLSCWRWLRYFDLIAAIAENVFYGDMSFQKAVTHRWLAVRVRSVLFIQIQNSKRDKASNFILRDVSQESSIKDSLAFTERWLILSPIVTTSGFFHVAEVLVLERYS